MSIRFEQVKKRFGSKVVLDGLSFEVSQGEILFILGKSGMGKSVILKHTVGLLQPTEGRILVNGRDMAKLTPQELAEVRRECGMIFQHPALLDSLTVAENVSFGLRTPQFLRSLPRPLSEEEILNRVREKLTLVHLGDSILDRYPAEISYGMQKRVSIARTLAPQPSYLLFDEPTTGLDPITTHAVNDLIFELSRKLKVTSVVVSHDMSCAIKIADRILVLDKGKILALGTVKEIMASKEELIQGFMAETLALSVENAL